MRTLKYIYSIGLVALLASCSNYLDVKPLESISDTQTIYDKTSSVNRIVLKSKTNVAGKYLR